MKLNLILTIVVLSIFMSIDLVIAQSDLEFHDNSSPVLKYKGQTLIYSVNSSYRIGSHTYIADMLNKYCNDSNVCCYIWGDGVMNFIPGLEQTFGPEETLNQSTGQYEIYNESTSQYEPSTESNIKNNSVKVKYPYGTELNGGNSYLNFQSQEISYVINYQIKNKEVESIAPIIFDFGDWPIEVSNLSDYANINDTLVNTLNDSTIMISDNDKILIISTRNPDFSYKIQKLKNNCTLSVEKMANGREDGVLDLSLRPITIPFQISISDFYPSDVRNSFRYKPEFQFNISSYNITNITFSYLSEGKQIDSPKTLDQNGHLKFDDWVQLNDNSIRYPFDSYDSIIKVNPPFLKNINENLDMPTTSTFIGSIDVSHHRIITISFSRPPTTVGWFFIMWIIAIALIYRLYIYKIGPISIKEQVTTVLAYFIGITSCFLSMGYYYLICIQTISFVFLLIFGVGLIVFRDLIIQKLNK